MKTIAAISTPIGHGGIGIVRVSGDDALKIIEKVFVPKHKGKFKPYTLKFGNIIDEQGNVLDQVLISYFKAPKTYTGEDICEVNCHGGLIVTKQILDLLLKNGASMAEPGEFTKRAFLNGKIDLTQAEAVIDLINSKSAKENSASVKQIEGFLGEKIKEIKRDIVDLLVDIEANIDYPEYDVEEVRRERIETVLQSSISKIEKLEATFESGKVLREGVNTAIIGKPNVGKSSLLNALLKENRAIVTEIAGTTRDTIEEYVTIKGIPLKLIDTAGIRDTSDVVENIGIEKSKKAIDEAELVLLILDATSDLTAEDRALLDLIKDKKHIVLINKIDAGSKVSEADLGDDNIIRISIKNGDGLDLLESKIENMFELCALDSENDVVLTNSRHQALILKAKEGIINALNSAKNGLPLDMLSIDISEAIQKLGEITGETVSEEVISGIFAKFCLGK